jgi:hypothetical protein
MAEIEQEKSGAEIPLRTRFLSLRTYLFVERTKLQLLLGHP